LFRRAVLSPVGDSIVVERQAQSGTEVALIALDSGEARRLAEGQTPFFSRDRKRVLFAALDDPKRLDSIAIGGGAVTKLASLPMSIRDGVDSAAGIQLELGDTTGTTHAWTIGPDAVARDAGVEGLVFQADSGWRAVRTGKTLRVYMPDGTFVFERPNNSRPTWVSDHELGYCDSSGAGSSTRSTRTRSRRQRPSASTRGNGSWLASTGSAGIQSRRWGRSPGGRS
jgi:hypothetical protein